MNRVDTRPRSADTLGPYLVDFSADSRFAKLFDELGLVPRHPQNLGVDIAWS